MRTNSVGSSPEIIDLNGRNSTGSVLTKGTVVYFNNDGLTLTSVANSNQNGKLLQDIQPNGGYGYLRVLGPWPDDGTYINYLGGGGSGTGVQIGTEPTPSVSVQGQIWLTPGGAGVADIVRICIKDETDAYIFVPIT